MATCKNAEGRRKRMAMLTEEVVLKCQRLEHRVDQLEQDGSELIGRFMDFASRYSSPSSDVEGVFEEDARQGKGVRSTTDHEADPKDTTAFQYDLEKADRLGALFGTQALPERASRDQPLLPQPTIKTECNNSGIESDAVESSNLLTFMHELACSSPSPRDPNLDNSDAIYQCKICKKQIAGGRSNLRLHISHHEVGRMECPFENCEAKLTPTAAYKHIAEVHERSVCTFNMEEFDALEEVKARFNKEMDTFTVKYFPPENFLGTTFAITKCVYAPECLKCGQKLTTTQGRSRHVAMHLNLRIGCPILGCKQKLTMGSVYTHVSTQHHRKVSQLTQEEDVPYRKAEKQLMDQIEMAIKYFFKLVPGPS